MQGFGLHVGILLHSKNLFIHTLLCSPGELETHLQITVWFRTVSCSSKKQKQQQWHRARVKYLNLCLQGTCFSFRIYHIIPLLMDDSFLDAVIGYSHISGVTHGRSPPLAAAALLLHEHGAQPCCSPLLQLPPCSVPEIMEPWNISDWKGLVRIKTETFSTKPTHFHKHHLQVSRKCSSSEHKISGRVCYHRDAAKLIHIKQIYPVLMVCRDQNTLLGGLWHLVAAKDNLHCHHTRGPAQLLLLFQSCSGRWTQPPVSNTSTTPTHHL